ncbi:MAG: hypothetical protein R2695_15340 [Acidimicrobiales bacterium]
MPLSKVVIVGHSQNDPGHDPVDPAPSFRSAPAQNARPAPVTIATQASSSSRNVVHAASRAVRIAPLTAFSASGRL